MKKTLFQAAACAASISILTGCAGYDQWAESTNRKMNTGWTEMLYGKGEGSGIPGPAASKFYDKLLGDVTYTKSCKNMLMFNAGMFNDAGGLIRTEPIVVGPYTAGTKALISKDVIADPQMQKSNQVTRLVLSGARCM